MTRLDKTCACLSLILAGFSTLPGCAGLHDDATMMSPVCPPHAAAHVGSGAAPGHGAATMIPAVPPASSQSVVVPLSASADVPCAPAYQDWQRVLQTHSARMEEKVESLEEQLALSQETLQAIKTTLQSSQQEISRLSGEVGFWKGEVQRLESQMESQQQADLESLDELSKILSRLLMDREHTSAKAGP